ncbi:MAG: hypothetical protein IKM16_00920 [Clostridia bacterium]|nr:hypothetical protein [Clostridia bacterium]MBR7141104.1 hypothetical protein [Clostridia bacterium]
MKRIITLILTLLLVFCATACEATISSANPTYPAPWCINQTEDSVNTAYEKSVYAITKTDKFANKIIAEGSLTFELKPAGKVENVAYSTLTMDMSITYNEFASEVDRGKTDTITSSVTFTSAALTATKSSRTVTIADREGMDNPSYTLENDYKEGYSKLTMGEFEHTISLKGHSFVGIIDNELLYFYVRAYPSLNNGLMGYFKMADFFDMHSRGDSFSPIDMRLTTAEAGKDQTLYFPTLKQFLSDDEGSAITLPTSIYKYTEPTGPPIQLWFSKNDFNVGENKTTKLVLTYIRTVEYDLASLSIQFETDYKLVDYSVTQGA